jgi:hypothetical protein
MPPYVDKSPVCGCVVAPPNFRETKLDLLIDSAERCVSMLSCKLPFGFSVGFTAHQFDHFSATCIQNFPAQSLTRTIS